MHETELSSLISHLPEIHQYELKQLINQMRPKGFTTSKQLTIYIFKNKLGYKYPNISGRLIMEKNGEQYNFDDAFPTNIYTLLCKALKLESQNSGARPVQFTPRKDL